MGFLFLSACLLHASHYTMCFTIIIKLLNINHLVSLWGYSYAHFIDEKMRNDRSNNLLIISVKVSPEIEKRKRERKRDLAKNLFMRS